MDIGYRRASPVAQNLFRLCVVFLGLAFAWPAAPANAASPVLTVLAKSKHRKKAPARPGSSSRPASKRQ